MVDHRNELVRNDNEVPDHMVKDLDELFIINAEGKTWGRDRGQSEEPGRLGNSCKSVKMDQSVNYRSDKRVQQLLGPQGSMKMSDNSFENKSSNLSNLWKDPFLMVENKIQSKFVLQKAEQKLKDMKKDFDNAQKEIQHLRQENQKLRQVNEQQKNQIDHLNLQLNSHTFAKKDQFEQHKNKVENTMSLHHRKLLTNTMTINQLYNETATSQYFGKYSTCGQNEYFPSSLFDNNANTQQEWQQSPEANPFSLEARDTGDTNGKITPAMTTADTAKVGDKRERHSDAILSNDELANASQKIAIQKLTKKKQKKEIEEENKQH